MMSFKAALILFLIGLTGIGLAVSADLPDMWILLCVAVGLGAWIVLAVWGFIDRTLGALHHLKRSREIDKAYKAEKFVEAKKVVQRGTSEAKKRATSKRLKLWLDTILGVRD